MYIYNCCHQITGKIQALEMQIVFRKEVKLNLQEPGAWPRGLMTVFCLPRCEKSNSDIDTCSRGRFAHIGAVTQTLLPFLLCHATAR